MKDEKKSIKGTEKTNVEAKVRTKPLIERKHPTKSKRFLKKELSELNDIKNEIKKKKVKAKPSIILKTNSSKNKGIRKFLSRPKEKNKVSLKGNPKARLESIPEEKAGVFGDLRFPERKKDTGNDSSKEQSREKGALKKLSKETKTGKFIGSSQETAKVIKDSPTGNTNTSNAEELLAAYREQLGNPQNPQGTDDTSSPNLETSVDLQSIQNSDSESFEGSEIVNEYQFPQDESNMEESIEDLAEEQSIETPSSEVNTNDTISDTDLESAIAASLETAKLEETRNLLEAIDISKEKFQEPIETDIEIAKEESLYTLNLETAMAESLDEYNLKEAIKESLKESSTQVNPKVAADSNNLEDMPLAKFTEVQPPQAMKDNPITSTRAVENDLDRKPAATKKNNPSRTP